MVVKIAQSLLLAGAVTLGIVACAPVVDENLAATPTGKSVVSALAPLATASPESSGEDPVETAGPDSSAIEDGGLAAPAGSIDLRELPPSSNSAIADEFVELPAPGAPDPLARVVQLAREDLSIRIQTDIEEALFVDVEEVVWSDRSLGCPKPNTGYIVEETPGFKIILASGGERYVYHTDLGQNVVLCLDGEPAPLSE